MKRIDAIFAIEREINGRPADERLAVRCARTAPLVAALEGWMRNERGKLSRHSEVAKAMDCAALRSVGKLGCSPAPIVAASARQ